MSEHTKGLLTTFEVGNNGNLGLGGVDSKTSLLTIVDEDGTDFAALYHAADAKRLAACWNLLDGYGTEKFEGVSLAEFVAKQAYLNEMTTNDGLNISMSGMALQMVAASFAGQFKANGATNYLELSGNHPETGPFTITMQRTHGLTPAQKLAAMTKQRDVLLSVLDWTDEQIMEFISTAFRHAQIKGDFELSDVRDALNMIKARAMSNLKGEQS
ncbi:TPA: hypothetical protein P2N04_001046 [Aeromonas salmonicida]|uniref:Uncharacterized protein n=1 Tax=Aeromonas salmonicida subsp. salmonicida TaxID=29491 RepID=A0A8F3IWH3_AERSS|nr:hypothetical protein [Aeromonas salmonicida]MBM9522658.1 hypothetical protein [Aeromonas salmonicida subsp. salmonicida]QWY91779.1 hypothetical protein [Aeromonas salmonicida subsp. salmonicida]HDN9803992.1 hypothetical protein [Aeromonas salmonicida]HDO0961076.1 hypothetical protein [Aeromonas salmonicida]HDO0965703.1 hypothetical protein [Aeromonas salmonicida]